MRVARALIAPICFLTLVAIASPGWTDDREARQILVVSSDAGLQARLSVEFQIMGYQPIAVVDEPSLEVPWRLDALAKERAAIAAVRVAYTDTGWQAVVADRVTGKTVLRQLDADAHDHGTVALQTVELLRASLLELALPARSTKIEAAPAMPKPVSDVAAAAPTPKPSAPTFSRQGHVLLAPAVLSSVRGVSPEWLGHLAFRVLLRPKWVLSMAGLFNVAASPLTGVEGQSGVKSYLAGLGLLRRLQQGRITLDAGLQLWGGVTHFDSDTTPGYTADVALHPAGAAMGLASAGVAVTQNLQLTFDLAAGVGVPWVQLTFAERQAGTWGLPIGYAALGLQYQVF
ncbi:MAG: hypothetical protein SF187_05685 [Deltaproteobacteria bacterium]|nr:hypothetical protein [Deltaproteobacteria bacterium]